PGLAWPARTMVEKRRMAMTDLAYEDRSEALERAIKIHTADDFAAMRKAGRLAAEVIDFITPYVKPGVTTGELDKLCDDYTLERGAISAPLNYRGFPKSICTSINHVV